MLIYVKNCIFVRITDKIFGMTGPDLEISGLTAPQSGDAGSTSS